MPVTTELTSLADLRCQADAWDDLWRRSGVNFPTARAELVAQWAEQFAPGAKFRAVIVKKAGIWLAALPLVQTRLLRVIRAGMLPINDWIGAGELLIDLRCDVPRVLDALVAGLARLSWPVLRFNEVRLESPEWRALEAALQRANVPISVCRRYAVGWLDVDHDWEGFVGRWSTSFRKQTLKSLRRLEKVGEVGLQSQRALAPDSVEGVLRSGFEVEHRSWKGRAGTSVLSSGMFPFFLRQTRQLADWGQLHLATLTCGGRAIAFQVCAEGKGVVHAIKIGYDDEYAKFGPGLLLHYHLFRELWGDPSCRAIDFTGPFGECQQHWKPASYPIGRVIIGSRRMLGRAAVYVDRRWLPRLRRARNWFRAKHRALPRQHQHTELELD